MSSNGSQRTLQLDLLALGPPGGHDLPMASIIRPFRPEDARPVSVLLVTTFDQPTEARLVDTLRADGDMAIELVAETDGALSGHIAFSRMFEPRDWLALAPVCVRTADQGRGIGGELIRYGLDAARQDGVAAVIVVGDPAYYTRFGFVFDPAARLEGPYPTRYTGLYPIRPGVSEADVRLAYPDAFAGI